MKIRPAFLTIEGSTWRGRQGGDATQCSVTVQQCLELPPPLQSRKDPFIKRLAEDPQCYCGGFRQMLTFLSVFIARKQTTGLIIQYASLNIIEKIIIPKSIIFTETRTRDSFSWLWPGMIRFKFDDVIMGNEVISRRRGSWLIASS
jgi:hypothetical protein